MTSGFNLGHDWEIHDHECPSCGQEFTEEWGDNDPPVLHREYVEGTSEHGEYIEVRCVHCETPVQRHYPEDEVTQQEDPLVEPTGWVNRAEELHHSTALPRREAHVQALKERGNTHSEIADILDIEPSTVREYARRIKQRFSEAEETLKLREGRMDLTGILSASIDGVQISPTSNEICSECNGDLKPGDTAVVPFEWGQDHWREHNLYCTNCSKGELHHNVHGRDIKLNDFLEELQGSGIPCAVVEGSLEQVEPPSNDSSSGRHIPLLLTNPSVKRFYPA